MAQDASMRLPERGNLTGGAEGLKGLGVEETVAEGEETGKEGRLKIFRTA